MSIRACCLLYLITLSVNAQDGVIYKCVDASGRVVFQNAPCPSGHETKSARAYTDPGFNPYLAEKVERDRRAVEDRRSRSRRNEGDYSFGRPSSPSSSRASHRTGSEQSACEAARSQRDAFRRSAGLQTTYDQRRHYDERVYEACQRSDGIR